MVALPRINPTIIISALKLELLIAKNPSVTQVNVLAMEFTAVFATIISSLRTGAWRRRSTTFIGPRIEESILHLSFIPILSFEFTNDFRAGLLEL